MLRYSPPLKIGLVTDGGGVNDQGFNQSAWMGIQKAAADFGWQAKFVESKQMTDFEKNIDAFATEGYDMIITVGFLMGDATAKKALEYPDIKFAIVDNEYFPAKEGDPDPYIAMKNVTSLMFKEDEAGFLAGVLAGGITKTGVICSVSGMEIPPVVRFVKGYQNGAKWMKSDIRTLNVYIPSFVDPEKGKETGLAMITQGCDVLFNVGGMTGNGGLMAAQERGIAAIGVDVDQYYTFPAVKEALVSSAMKNIDVAVYAFLKTVKDNSYKSGVFEGNAGNSGIGLAPFHDWENRVPANVKAKIIEATEGLKNGTISTGVP